MDGDGSTGRKWQTDPWLDESETLEATPSTKDDYRNARSGEDYDRGHMTPLAAFKGSKYVAQVNFYSNIEPQKADLNEGPWERLESTVGDLVRRYGSAWIMTGPLYENEMPPLPKM